MLLGHSAREMSAQQGEIANLQGEMAGEVTTDSVILQSRLTGLRQLENDDVPGAPGVARFEISTEDSFEPAIRTDWITAHPGRDYIVKKKITGLTPATRYSYRLVFGPTVHEVRPGPVRHFRTHPSAQIDAPVSFAVVTCMNYYFFHYGKYNRDDAYRGADKRLGYPALEAIQKLRPDFFVSTGDNVYLDHPGDVLFQQALKAGKNPHPSPHGGKEAQTETAMRHKYHEQFVQPRFVQLFATTPTYWQKDDHDYRTNDSWPAMQYPISHELGVRDFVEQLPVTDPADPRAVTYRTHRVGKLLQLWFVENRDYRSPNTDPDGPQKTIWGAEQKAWLKRTLAESDATFKLLISPTPMVGPDIPGGPVSGDKADNHCNPGGFQHEAAEFFAWAKAEGIDRKRFFILCGDRHWQYHSIHPSGFEEFSSGTLVKQNAARGIKPGDKRSSDPEGLIKQPFISPKPAGAFLQVNVRPPSDGAAATLIISFYDETGAVLHRVEKTAPAP